MQRRTFITLIGGAAAWPLVARAQQPAKVKRIAIVSPSGAPPGPTYKRASAAFSDELSRVGFVEGKNLVIEGYSAAGQPNRFAPLAREVVDTRPDAIYAVSSFLGDLYT